MRSDMLAGSIRASKAVIIAALSKAAGGTVKRRPYAPGYPNQEPPSESPNAPSWSFPANPSMRSRITSRSRKRWGTAETP